MAYRRIDLTLPDDDRDPVELCEDFDLIDHHRWPADPNDEHGPRRVTLLVREDAAEPVVAKLQELYGDSDVFRAAVIQLAAIAPVPDEPEADEKNDAGDDEDQKKLKQARGRISKDELLNDLRAGTRVSTTYLVTVLLSSIIAAVGLVRDNPAVVIGAMVIAPLLLPNMSLALGTTLGDFRMMARSLGANAAGLGVCLAFAVAVGWLVDFDPSVKEIASRTEATYSDAALALAAGAAGAVAVTSGVAANLIGVMVAVALLPPLVALGLLLGAGRFELADNTALLVAINLTCVNLAAVATFLCRGVRPATFYEAERARKATYGALTLWVLAVGVTLLLIWLVGGQTDR
ncbi:MAG: TIGR00341 family protein [Planctomycetota bacterium]